VSRDDGVHQQEDDAMKTMFGLALMACVGLLTGAGSRATADDHEGPHKGIVVEWGDEEYHPELVIDKKEGTVTAYIYGDHKDLHKAKLKAIDSKTLTLSLKTTPTTTKLEPAPSDDKERKDDPKGKSTKFVGKNDALKMDAKWEGTLSGKIGDKPYTGTFKQK
jgi:hypothetical protein